MMMAWRPPRMSSISVLERMRIEPGRDADLEVMQEQEVARRRRIECCQIEVGIEQRAGRSAFAKSTGQEVVERIDPAGGDIGAMHKIEGTVEHQPDRRQGGAVAREFQPRGGGRFGVQRYGRLANARPERWHDLEGHRLVLSRLAGKSANRKLMTR